MMNTSPHALQMFGLLSREDQLAAIRKLAAGGAGDHEISRLTGWHVDAIRRELSAGISGDADPAAVWQMRST